MGLTMQLSCTAWPSVCEGLGALPQWHKNKYIAEYMNKRDAGGVQFQMPS